MTAIAGVWRLDGRPDADVCTTRMLAAQSMYGRHGGAQWSGHTVALGRQLFQLLPEDCHDRGPVVSANARFTLVADVRIDNRDDLTGALDIAPDRARNMCDAALLLAAFERWDEAAVDRIVGDFAFAVWDATRRRLVLGRDFLGCRPLHYHRGANSFAFASMPKGLHALDEIPRESDDERVAETLLSLPAFGTRTFFKGIERVEPGHIVTVTPTALSARRYWNPSRGTTALTRADDYVDGLRHHLDTAVRCRLRGAGARVGAHLSAGLDSSSVAATAARILAPTAGRVTAFTAVPREGYDGRVPPGHIGDEGPLAALTAARHPNIEHVVVTDGGRSPFEELDRSLLLYERPLRNACNSAWMHAINDSARDRGLSVLLTGQLGNLGMSYTGMELFPELLSAGRVLALVRQVRAARSQGRAGLKSLAALTVFPFLPASITRRLNRALTHESRTRRYTGVNTGLLSRLGAGRLDERFSNRRWRDSFSIRLWGLRRVDVGDTIKGVLGGWGIDQRDPTADKRLVEFCLTVPTEQFLFNGIPRSLALRAFADRLPREVLDERRRGYQAADWHETLTAAREAAAAEVDRLMSCKSAAAMLDLPRLRSLVDNWPDSDWDQGTVSEAYRVGLIRGISVGHFLRNASEREKSSHQKSAGA